ncbi:MAG: hypothetical protein RR250_04620 [Akkermansia sp.]
MYDPTVQQPGKPVTQFSVMLNNRAGALASLLQLLETRYIYCLGFSIQDNQEATIVRMILSDPDEALALLLEKGIGFTSCELLVISLIHGAEDLASCLETLAQAKINIDFLYPLFPVREGKSRLAIHVADPTSTGKFLNTAGIPILYQEDLSR